METLKAIADFLSGVVSLMTLIFPKERERRRELGQYVGPYQGYHIATDLSGNISASRIDVREKFGRRLEVEMVSGDYEYRGSFRVDESIVWISLQATKSGETLQMVFNEPLNKKFTILDGVFSAMSETRIPTCGKYYMERSNEQLLSCQIPRDQCDPEVVAFLFKTTNPIVVPKRDIPKRVNK
jgi:hypothetical protein